jgi:hypothetical protein
LTQAEFCADVPATAPEQALCAKIYADPLYLPLLQSYSTTQPDLQWQIVKILREYSYKHTTWAPNAPPWVYSPYLIGNIYGRTWSTAYQEMGLVGDTAPHRYQVFDSFNSGVFCADTAQTLRILYEMFGYTAYQYHIQFDTLTPQHDIFSHVQTLVSITYNGASYVTLHDPSLNFTFANPDGSPMDYVTVLAKLAQRDAAHIRLLGDVNSPPNDPDQHLLRAHTLYAPVDYGSATVQQIADGSDTIDPDNYSWESRADTRLGFGPVWDYASPRAPARMAQILSEPDDLASVGEPRDPRYLELFVQAIYNRDATNETAMLAAAWNAIATNSDLSDDIVWQNASTGGLKIWLLHGTAPVRIEPPLGPGGVADTSWEIVGKGDFNGDGWTDLLWRNQITFDTVVWFMHGTTLTGTAYLNPNRLVTDPNWLIGGVGDFNGDGNADILWRNRSTGQDALWFMNGVNLSNAIYIFTVADTDWQVVGTGDLNGDGRADVLWRHQTTGVSVVWFMDDSGNLVNWQYLPTIADTTWQIVGTGDFNSDNQLDTVWRNSSSGLDVVLWLSATEGPTAQYLPTLADVTWKIR